MVHLAIYSLVVNNLNFRLCEAFACSQRRDTALRAVDPLTDRLLFGGLENRTHPKVYDWDGLRRGVDADHPVMIFQYTLAGYGCYAAGGQISRVPPEHAFVAIVPSAHRYYLPPESPSWHFFYLLIPHDYIVSRFADAGRRYGAVVAMPSDSVVLSRAVTLFEGMCRRSFPDAYAAEQAMLEFMIEYERHLHQGAASPSQRDQLLLPLRQYVLRQLSRAISVEELASLAGMSRSNYTHHFRAVTGLSPAHYVNNLRLQEVSRRLLGTRLPLKSIADETGFADANHLCKAFRRAFHISPGQYRRQRGG